MSNQLPHDPTMPYETLKAAVEQMYEHIKTVLRPKFLQQVQTKETLFHMRNAVHQFLENLNFCCDIDLYCHFDVVVDSSEQGNVQIILTPRTHEALLALKETYQKGETQ